MTVFVSEGTGSIIDGGVSAGLFPASLDVETDGDDDVEEVEFGKFSLEGKEGVRGVGVTGDDEPTAAAAAAAAAPPLTLKSVLPILFGSFLEDN